MFIKISSNKLSKYIPIKTKNINIKNINITNMTIINIYLINLITTININNKITDYHHHIKNYQVNYYKIKPFSFLFHVVMIQFYNSGE